MPGMFDRQGPQLLTCTYCEHIAVPLLQTPLPHGYSEPSNMALYVLIFMGVPSTVKLVALTFFRTPIVDETCIDLIYMTYSVEYPCRCIPP